MMDSDVNIKSKVNYVTDIKSKLEIERYLLLNVGLRFGTFGEVLAKLGFDPDKKLYLKRKNVSGAVGLMFNYSYDKDKFDDKNMIKMGCDFSRCIELVSNGQEREYNIRGNYNNQKLYLENEYFEQKNTVNGINYYYCVYNGELEIFISNDLGDSIEFCYDVIYDENEMISKLVNNKELQEYITNINFSDSKVDIFNSLCKYVDILNFVSNNGIVRDISIKYLKNDEVLFNYSVEKYYDNSNIEVYLYENETEVNYELNKEISHNNIKYTIILNSNYNELRFEFEIDDVNFEIKNELELRSYLLGLKYPIKIEDIIKKISEISLGDIGRYNSIYLNIFNNETNEIDRIILENGKLIEFKLNRDGRVFQFNKDGEFHYEVIDDVSKYSVDMINDLVVGCNQYCQNGIDNTDDSNRIVYKVIRDAKEGKVRVKELLDGMIKKGSSD